MYLIVFFPSLVTGIITVLQSLRLDNPRSSRSYVLEIEARDDGNNTSSYVFTVFVEDVDDPISCDPYFSTGAGIFQVHFISKIPKRCPLRSTVETAECEER